MQHTINGPRKGVAKELRLRRTTECPTGSIWWRASTDGTRAHRRGRPARRTAEREAGRPDRRPSWSSSSAWPQPACATSRSTSFVSPKWVPQMADHAEVMRGSRAPAGRELSRADAESQGLRGRGGRRRDRGGGVRRGVRELSRRRTSTARSTNRIERFVPVRDAAAASGVKVRGYVSCVVGCPYEGEIAPARVADVAARAVRTGLLRGVAWRHDRRRHAGVGAGDAGGRARSECRWQARGALSRHVRHGLANVYASSGWACARSTAPSPV